MKGLFIMPRGGKRPGAGRPRKPLAEKIATGNPSRRPIKILEFTGEKEPDRPVAPEYLSEMGGGSGSCPSAKEIFDKTVDWLETTGCVHLISPQLIDDFALHTSRRLWAEYEIFRRGLVYRDAKRERLVMNEYVKTSHEYYKMASAAWDKIWRIVAQNSEKDFTMSNPGTDLLRKIYGVKMQSAPKPVEDDYDRDEY